MQTSSRLNDWLKGVAVGGLLYASVSAKPVPAPRPRVSRFGGVYYTKNYVEYVNACQQGFSQTRGQGDWPEGPLEGPLAVAVDVRCERPKSSKLAHPRGDVDNHAKGPLDAGTKCRLWADDNQITSLSVQKRWAEEGEEAGITLLIARLA